MIFGNRKTIIILWLIIIMLSLFTLCYCISYPFKNVESDETKTKYRESDYVNAYCNGKIEYMLPDKTRIDCLTDDYAIEFDWAKKWAESIGQSLYYAKMTGKKPAVAIIVKSQKDYKYIERIKKVDKNIMIFTIKAQDFEK